MALVDHLGITVSDLEEGRARFDPLFGALGFTRSDAEESSAWYREGEPELILYGARDTSTAPHVHGRVGWQHLAFAVGSRDEVERMHALALEAGWHAVRAPKEYPRFSGDYYASFVEDADGIRLEFMTNSEGSGA
ncbi:VOC family protein [Salinibacterium sp. ZJ77]|uniref:VOC family protein n=1 Tax=Salinibacterium sp. ZJ77 TaxID=2708337 RepID=UPI00141EE69E|nr:VOC family protein [Salinibacterium sp. ZJ77]